MTRLPQYLPSARRSKVKYRYLKVGDVARAGSDDVNYNAPDRDSVPNWVYVHGLDGHIVTQIEADRHEYRRWLVPSRTRLNRSDVLNRLVSHEEEEKWMRERVTTPASCAQ